MKRTKMRVGQFLSAPVALSLAIALSLPNPAGVYPELSQRTLRQLNAGMEESPSRQALQKIFGVPAAGLEEAEEAALKVLSDWADVKTNAQAAGRVLPAIIVGPSLVKRWAVELAVLDKLLKRPELDQRNPLRDYVYLVTEGSEVSAEVLQKFGTADEARQTLGERSLIYFRGDEKEELFSKETDPHLTHVKTV